MKRKVYAEISSEKGFYIGDVCYAMKEEFYRDVWGDQLGFEDGCHEVPEYRLKFAVCSTYYGDGEYRGTNGVVFPVDAGNIGVVPLEMCSEHKLKSEGYEDCGVIVEQPGTVFYTADDGVFEIDLPGGSSFSINTRCEEDDDCYDDEEDEDDE